ncbi:MAG: GntR family transcriptional regulator [Ancalomicrobiaceae bacterium]|nr:GntR family transcriptional regulator [Ancalomicrobiaceae bacterium]
MSQDPSSRQPVGPPSSDRQPPERPSGERRSDNTLAALVAAEGARPKTATEFVEATLKKGILSGALPAGMALRQEDLAREFGLSRMPIREALRQLEAQALIDFTAHKGAVVTEISLEDALDLFAIRRALETAAFALSIPNLSPDDLGRAVEVIAEIDTEADAGRLGQLNRQFHMTLYARAGRPKLLTLVEAQLASYDRYLRFHLSAEGREQMAQDDHRAMVEAAATRDVAGAIAVLERHIDTAADALTRFYAMRDGAAQVE